MRTFVVLPVVATAVALAAIATWGAGMAGPRAAAPEHRPTLAASGGHAPAALGVATPPSGMIPRYRADACGGDYVCGESGAWESVPPASTEVWPLTSDGY